MADKGDTVRVMDTGALTHERFTKDLLEYLEERKAADGDSDCPDHAAARERSLDAARMADELMIMYASGEMGRQLVQDLVSMVVKLPTLAGGLIAVFITAIAEADKTMAGVYDVIREGVDKVDADK